MKHLASEVVEAMYEYQNFPQTIFYGREGKPEGFAIELADIIILTLGMCDEYDINIEEAMNVKIKYLAGKHGVK